MIQAQVIAVNKTIPKAITTTPVEAGHKTRGERWGTPGYRYYGLVNY